MSTPWDGWFRAAALALGTLASEDLACLAAGQLIREQQLSVLGALLACFAGVYLGDLGLWALGRFGGQRLLGSRWISRWVPTPQIEAMGCWFDRCGGLAVFASRFLPGTRLPLYIAAGSLGRNLRTFAVWSLLAALVWTPLLVLGAAGAGWILNDPLFGMLDNRQLGAAVSIPAVLLVLAAVRRVADRRLRRNAVCKLARFWQWEFWPTWLFYLPILPWIVWLALRYRSVTVWTAANPGIPHGGVVGESKYSILSRLAGEGVLPTIAVGPGDVESRTRQVTDQIRQRGWRYPIILKPDAAQRGAGVRLIRTETEVRRYFESSPQAVIAQPYHPGPFEAGVFYYRIPGEVVGSIFSITDKHFPVVVGDGISTLEELIWRHPRFRMQAETFLRRHADQTARTLCEAERFPLAVAGNHCQGTMFRDGQHLHSPELERTIDAIARRLPEFYIGRFDIRYSDVSAFRAGRDLAVVELNGVTSESTNIYDPARSLWSAYRILFRQWELIFRIGNANRRRGIQQTTLAELVRCVRESYSRRTVDPLAD